MQRSRHWFIGSGLGGLVAATLAVFTDAAMPPAAPRPAPLAGATVPAGAVSPFADPALSPHERNAPDATTAPADAPADAPAAAAPAAPAALPSLAPATAELQALLEELTSRPAADAALDRELRDGLLADVRQRLAELRGTGGEATEIAQLERMAARLHRLP